MIFLVKSKFTDAGIAISGSAGMNDFYRERNCNFYDATRSTKEIFWLR